MAIPIGTLLTATAINASSLETFDSTSESPYRNSASLYATGYSAKGRVVSTEHASSANSVVDVLIVGAGNAALCAALAAHEEGATVAVLECAPRPERGGNTAFTAGAMRVAFDGVEDLRQLMPDLAASQIEQTDFGSYPESAFFDDMARVTEYRADPDLVELLVKRSFETLMWMQSFGIRFAPSYGRQAFKVDGQFRFWGGLVVETVGGGPGLVEGLVNALEARNIPIHYETRAVELILDDTGSVRGIRARNRGHRVDMPARTVVLAAGGFEANAEWRSRYLGPGWDVAKVRGTRFNNGDGIRMALEVGASPAGNWSGCHAVGWDLNAPEFGDLAVGDGFQKHSYPFGIMVNAKGKRFVDEGADFRNYTYAKYGREILKQPGHVAWQVFDDKVSHLLRDEYHIREVSSVSANTLEELAQQMEGVDADSFTETVRRFNDSIKVGVAFDPNIRDGRCTTGIDPPKSNWALPLDTPPYQAFATTCGVTFTFGGLRIDTDGCVLSHDQSPIPGLFACGELVGGLFYFNYPGGSGLTSGSVFGRIAGASAAAKAQSESRG